MRGHWVAGVVLCCLIAPAPAAAAHPQIDGYVQLWGTLYEQLENGLRQAGSGDAAQQEVSGFSLRRVRLAVQDTLGSSRTYYRIEALLEKSVRLTDCYLVRRLTGSLEVRAGQMKVPSTYEALQSSRRTDFVERTQISALISDWSLSRTPYISSFMGNRAYLRDLGVGLQADRGPVRCLAMVGNGLGANLFVGGTQNREYVLTNGLAQWLYALRLDVGPVRGLRLGAHGLLNQHDGMLFNDDKTVIDLRRRSWSVDAAANLGRRAQVTGLYAAGAVDDDYYRDGKRNYAYHGSEAKLMGWLLPQRLQAGIRFDRYVHEFSQSGTTVAQDNWALGLNWQWDRRGRLQLNRIWTRTDEAYQPDLADDALLLCVQFEL
jgi:hypothetical protein